MNLAKHRRPGFTLIEVLIVVVIMAVLAATIIPQFSESTKDAKESSLQFNLHSLRSQIELYKLHHLGAVPTITAGAIPQMTSATDVDGNIGTAGPSFPYGPYMLTMPANPITGSTTVTANATFPAATESGGGGWLYSATTGQISPDTTAYLAW